MISKEEVKHIAKLARLGLTEKEIEKLQRELSLILDYFEKLKKIDLSKIEPASYPLKIENVMRNDEVKERDLEKIKKLLEMAPEKKEGYLKVKQIL